MGKRGPRPNLTVDDIVAVALKLVAQRGIEALSLSALARTLGTSPSGLYRYFDSKEAILLALQERAIAGYHDHVVASLEAARRRPGDGLMAIEAARLRRVVVAFSAYATHAGEHPAEHRLMDAFLSAPSPVLSDEAAAAVAVRVDAVVDLCATTLDEAADVGALTPGDGRRRTYLLWAALHGLDHFRKRDRIQPQGLRTAALLPELFEAMLRGFGAPPSALSRALVGLSRD